ncbi:unnamed protein product [Rotaria sordida]|uniref:Uncharacterized protein n=1 Tax=Rotaria sordida TaxID=392033 RepID=A0A815RL27_9BILA|nr:unnamed protein product [Rotaria sordida]
MRQFYYSWIERSITTNRNNNHSWIDQTLSPYGFIEQNHRKHLSNKILDTLLYDQDHELKDDYKDNT